MRPLELNQKFLTLVSLCAPPDDVTRPEILWNAAVGLYVFVTLWSDLISSTFFLIQYKKRELEDVLGSILQIAAVSSNIFGMVTVFVLSKRLQNIFFLFEKIYNECNYRHNSILFLCKLSRSLIFFLLLSIGAQDKSFQMFDKINRLATKVTAALVIKYVLGYYVLSITLALVNFMFCYIKAAGEIDIACLYTPYKHV